MTLRDYFGEDLGIEHYYRHPRSYARMGVFSVDEPSPTIRGVNRPIPNGYPGHAGDAAPITTPGLRPLTTRERSRVQTFPANWDLSGNKSDIEQIIGNAVPCALGTFIGRALARFDQLPHRESIPSMESVLVFTQYENPRNDDIREVVLEPVDSQLIAQEIRDEQENQEYKPCQPIPTQMLLAMERKRAKLTAKQLAKGFKGQKLNSKRSIKKRTSK